MKKQIVVECKELLFEFFQKNLFENAYRDLAQEIETRAPNVFKMNRGQGKVKSYAPPHSRITVSPSAPEFANFISTVQSSPDKFEVLYIDSQARADFLNTLAGLLNISPKNLSLAKQGTYSSGGYPAINVTIPHSSIPTGVVVFSFPSARVQSGAIYQASTLSAASKELINKGYKVTNSSLAKKGSHEPDVKIETLSSSNIPVSIQIEVKGPSGKIFDKTVERGIKAQPHETEKILIDAIAAACAQANNFKATTLNDYIDEIRNKLPEKDIDQKVGYSGDPKIAQRGGALLKKYFTTQLTQPIVETFRAHWSSHGDSYFAVSNQNTTYIWYTGHPASSKKENPLGAPPFDTDSISGNISLTTYGTTGKGRLRVAIEGKFNLSKALALA